MNPTVLYLSAVSPLDIRMGTVVEHLRTMSSVADMGFHWIMLNNYRQVPLEFGSGFPVLQLRPWQRPYRLFRTLFGHYVQERLWSRKAAAMLDSYCRQQNVTQVWAVVERTVPAVACRLRAVTGLPLHVTLHDHPFRNYQMEDDHPEWFWRRVENGCKKLLKAADSVDVVSTALSGYVEKITAKIPRVCLPKSRGLTKASTCEPNKHFKIGFTGNMHAGEAEVRCFLSWLSQCVNQVEFHIFGDRAFPDELKPLLTCFGCVVVHDYESDERKYVETLSVLDACYVGAWFSPTQDLTVRYSFPSKVAAICAAGVPVIGHGPDYGELGPWLKRYECGVWLNSVDDSNVPVLLKRLVQDLDYRRQCAKAATRFHEQWMMWPESPTDAMLPWKQS